mmetsp:Transcript_4312/g.9465  ORF Transcript_4312/g.9465 Transcript_4312/m.9465 type:complete len:208 (+) Transcript_4312:238-861(+)
MEGRAHSRVRVVYPNMRAAGVRFSLILVSFAPASLPAAALTNLLRTDYAHRFRPKLRLHAPQRIQCLSEQRTLPSNIHVRHPLMLGLLRCRLRGRQGGVEARLRHALNSCQPRFNVAAEATECATLALHASRRHLLRRRARHSKGVLCRPVHKAPIECRGVAGITSTIAATATVVVFAAAAASTTIEGCACLRQLLLALCTQKAQGW